MIEALQIIKKSSLTTIGDKILPQEIYVRVLGWKWGGGLTITWRWGLGNGSSTLF